MDDLFQFLFDGKQPQLTFFGQDPAGIIIAVAAFLFFLIGLIYLQMGIVILSSIAGHRAKRRPSQDKLFLTTKSYDDYLADLHKNDEERLQSATQQADKPSTSV